MNVIWVLGMMFYICEKFIGSVVKGDWIGDWLKGYKFVVVFIICFKLVV